ncbi:sensor histidine kinase [Kaistella rhinocerotis]|uniref:sensor histidine kinase n=1 Tax=Kaistella rhinocerotis TaxID=3026437 RepID=UPI0025568FE0|nr:histidine kinase [Kaistella sp. Ran72]
MEKYSELKLFFWFGTAIMVFLAVAVIFLALYYQSRLYKLKKKEAFLRMRAILNKEKEERARISSDLHDTVIGNLVSISIYFGMLKNQIKDPEVLGVINGIDDELRDTKQLIRQITYNLMPPLLSNNGFIASVEDFLRKSSVRYGFTYELNHLGFIEFSKQSSYDVLLILREFITNSCVHGGATDISITLTTAKKHNIITYKDNGAKYDFVAEMNRSTGYGLKNILSRVENLHGSLHQRESATHNEFVIFVKSAD